MTLAFRSPLVSIPLQGLPVAAAALDCNGVIVAANRRFLRLCGRAASIRSGRRLRDIVAEHDRPAVDAILANLALESSGLRTRTVSVWRASPPSLRLAIDVVRLEPDADVPSLAWVQAIARRRQFDVVPDRRHQDRSTTSSDAPLSAARNGDAWPAILMTLSHELRGPLTAIRGWTQMAEQGVLSPPKLSRALAVIGRNAASVSDMIESVFDLSRRAAGSLALVRNTLDLNPLVQLVTESAVPGARDHDVALTVTRAHTTLLIDGDPIRLEQVLRNLVENAVKFTPTGGHVHVQTRRTDGFAEVVVTDDGLGIPADQLPVIFEPFRHEDAAVCPSRRGLGLGLALVRELVHLHGGEVRALSQGRGRGSTFVMRLPLVSEAAARVGARHERLMNAAFVPPRQREVERQDQHVGEG